MSSLIIHGKGIFSRCFEKILEYFLNSCLSCLKHPSLISHENADLLGYFEKFLRFFLSRTDGIRKSRCCQRGKILRQNKNSRTVFTARQVRYYVIFFLRVDLFLWQLWLFLMVDNRRKTFRQEYTFSFGLVVLAGEKLYFYPRFVVKQLRRSSF